MRQAIRIGPVVNDSRVVLYEYSTSNGVITGYTLVYEMAEGPHTKPDVENFTRRQTKEAEKAWQDRVTEHLLNHEH